MRVVRNVAEMRALASERRRRGQAIGFVPTMGCLHEGHLSLVRLAGTRAPWVVVSIFVNPTQFGLGEDFEIYPRDLDRDCQLLEAEECDLAFAPTIPEMYTEGHRTSVSVGELSEKLCGRSRPGHFDGVTTVVLKLFNIIQPDVAVFGEKDAQQLVIIRRMVEDLNLAVEIVGAPTVRDPDGLAVSSRNRDLSPEAREHATCLFRALRRGEELFKAGERQADRMIGEMRLIVDAKPAVETDYVSVVDPVTLEDLDTIRGEALVAIAARVGGTRLIDNVRLSIGE
ncbi:MAG: pantoate--beta-alanine ligase [Candidatus Eisenbacteria sp.]|nr:pantoate--beta-alanine ligase [Candidatus Eisenbacteria bacterium]